MDVEMVKLMLLMLLLPISRLEEGKWLVVYCIWCLSNFSSTLFLRKIGGKWYPAGQGCWVSVSWTGLQ